MATDPLVLGGIVLAVVFASNNAARERAQNFANIDATTTAQAQEQLTNIAATVQAQAAANPDPYQPAGTLVLIDSLSQPSAWTTASDTNWGGQCQFVNGAYQVSQSISGTGRLYICSNNNQATYSNFAFEVNMTINQGDCGGLTMRNIGDNSNLYLFQVCQNGSYLFSKYTSHSGSTILSGNSSAIKQGPNQSNVIAVVANGSSFDLYVNSQKIDSASDNTYSQGFIGLIAEAINNATTVTYQNARVWTI